MADINKLLKISNQIINEYIDLLFNPIYEINEGMYSDKIKMIYDMVLEKYEIIRSMSMEELNFYINKLNVVNIDDNYESVIRVKNKLVDYREILKGIGISSLELGFDKIDNDMEFSIYDALLSTFNIDVIKSLKKKIYSLNSDCSSDNEFIDALKQRLNTSKIELLFNTCLSEVISLNYNVNIDEMPRINIDKIYKKIESVGNNNLKHLVQDTVVLLLTNIMEKLHNIYIVKNNDKNVFKYLVLITQFEVLIDYIDKSKLEELLHLCNSVTNMDNYANMSYVKRLIINKMNK